MNAKGLLASAFLLLASGAGVAAPVEVSPDTASSLGGTVVGPGNAAEDDAGTVTVTAIGPSAPGIVLGAGVNLDGFDRLPTGEVLFSTDVTVAVPGLPGAGVAIPSDVVMVTAGGPSIVLSGTAAGLPAGTDVDAIGLEADSDVLVSFDTTVNFNGTVADDEDVVRVDAGGATSLVYDGSAQGLSTQTGLDLDAVYRNLDDGHLLLSFDGSGSVPGVNFDDEDVLDWNPTNGVYAMAYDGSAAPTSWPTGSDLDAVSGFPTDTDGDTYPNATDNCPLVANDQTDSGGISPQSAGIPDGIGDACQCGDANNDGLVTGIDGTLVQRAALNLAPFLGGVTDLPGFAKCDVNGSACSGLDGTLIKRASLGLAPGVMQTCPAADGTP